MGQKVNPKSIRLKINEMWTSSWFGRQNYVETLISDLKIRKIIDKKLKDAYVSKVEIDRDANKLTINIHSSRPGVIIGRGGAGTEDLKKLIATKAKEKIQINIIEVKKPDADAAIIASGIANQLERRIPYRRAIKQAIEKAKAAGILGIKVMIGGRLNGADIARSEKISFGSVPLSTFKSDIDYKYTTALTTFGIIGIKVWVYKGERVYTSEDFGKN
ncbi:MAG: 30S ribosomal protein S3 [Candidatus Berkelbacteria bacterium]